MKNLWNCRPELVYFHGLDRKNAGTAAPTLDVALFRNVLHALGQDRLHMAVG